MNCAITSLGLNAGRWDFHIFSISKRFHDDKAFVMRERSAVTMTTPFMRAYSELLVKTCHRRGAYAIGGMSAFIPNRHKPAVTEEALVKVRDDKQREAGDGFDGTWVAHPDLVGVARAAFDEVLGGNPNQLSRQRPDVHVEGRGASLALSTPEHGVTPAGLRTNIDVGVRYIVSWLSGVGAAAIHDLMEDARPERLVVAQVWQWVRHGTTLSVGDKTITEALVRDLLDITETYRLARKGGELCASPRVHLSSAPSSKRWFCEEFATFLTLPLAYDFL